MRPDVGRMWAGGGAAESSDAELARRPEAEQLLREVRAVIEELGVGARRPVQLRSDLQRDLGLDSLAVVELYDRVEHVFGVRLPEEVLTAQRVADWLRTLVEAVAVRGPEAPAAVPAPPPRAPSGPAPDAAATLGEVLSWHVEAHPDLISVRLLPGSAGGSAEELSYGALSADAGAIARGLRALGLGRGERVAIMLPTARSFFGVFLGVLLAGAVPVPVYPPTRLAALEEHLLRQARVLDNAGAAVLVTVAEARIAARLVRARVPSLRAIRTPEELTDFAGPEGELLPMLAAGDLALVQYTSGSTGDPKGVMLTHEQLLANIRAMGQAAKVSSEDVFVSWLPLYHDMGLIGAFLAPLYFGFPLVITSPLVFLARPASWLEAITTYRGTLSAAPNFAYQACVDRIGDRELAALDLSSWRVAFNGSEPVSARTVEAFIERFARCGFRPGAMCPAYGLAEVGVGVAFSPLGRGARVDVVSRSNLERSSRALSCGSDDLDARAVVSSGRPLPGYEIRISDVHGNELPDRREGAVTCRGPSATAGYLANEAATRALWHRGWLETGDLGYIADGEVFLTGRAKDLVIRGGRNLHPEELEQMVETLEGVRPGGAAVFASVDQRLGTERLVLAIETDLAKPERRAALEDAARRRTIDLLGVPPDVIVLLPPSALLRTASGKLRRSATRAAFEAGVLGRHRAPVAVQLLRLGASSVQPAGRRLGRALLTWVFAGYAWAVTIAILAPVWIGVHLLPSRAIRWRLVRAGALSLCNLVGLPVEVQGPVPAKHKGAVVVANHESFVDGVLLVLAFRDPVALVASTDLGRQALVGSFLRRLGCAFVERGEPDRASGAIEELVRRVRAGERLVIFPEGSITRAPGLRAFRLGAFATATAAPCPVVPVGISGSRDVVRPGTYLARRGRITVAFGQPIAPEGSDFAAQIALRDRARRSIVELSGEPDLT